MPTTDTGPWEWGEKTGFPPFRDLAPDLRCYEGEAAKCRHGKIEMIEALNHVLETQKQLRAQNAAYSAPATGDVAGAPFELPPATAPSTALASANPSASKEFKLFGDDGFDVFDVLDMINPLQHIPVVSTIYRRMTGDELSPGARIVGATLLGGPIGAALAMADTAVEHETGKDTGANIYAALFGNEGPIPAAGTAVAAAAPWKDPDLDAATVTTASAGAGSVTFVAAAAPDLGALAEFTTGAGGRAALEASPTLQASATIVEPTFAAAPWKNPDLEPMDAPGLALLAQKNNAANNETHTIEAPAIETGAIKARVREPAAAETVAAVAAKTAPINAAPINAERPMPSDAAKAQAINALAAMPTSQTTAAVAELSRTDSRTTSRSHMMAPAGDIPKGAGASLSRKATSAYATSMGTAKPTQAEVSAAADAHNANTMATLERSTGDAQNDWMLGAMQSAMAKYEATAKLRSAANSEAQGNNAAGAGIAVTR